MRFILYEDGDESNEDSSDIIQAVTEEGDKVDVAAMMDELPPVARREVAHIIVDALNRYGVKESVLSGE